MNATRFGHGPQRSLCARVIVVLLVMFAAWAVFGAGIARADNPEPVQVYYVTLPEEDALTILYAVTTDAVEPMYTYFSIVIVVTDTLVYYDQWEDGYAADLANPTTAEIYSASNLDGVQIWGNGLAADGCAPNIAGVPLTCTDANDVFKAGDVVIPYNSIDLPRASGAAAYYVLDNFGTQSYSNNNGNTNWSTNWVETGDGTTGASSGTIYINTNSDHLRFREYSTTNDSIARGVSLPVGDACATLSFTLGENGIDTDSDDLRLQISSDGGTNWTTLETFNSSGDAGAKSYDISSYASANTRIRFIMVDNLEEGYYDGEYWSIDSVRIEWGCSVPIRFDARDKIGLTKAGAMTRAVWASGSSTLNALAHEIYDTSTWGTVYESPVGTNTPDGPSGYGMFEYTALSVMAHYDNTTVQIDADANGTYESTVVLDEGDTTWVSGILQGARVQGDKPINVVLLLGDIDSGYSSRDMNLLPVGSWDSSYWSPVGEYGYDAGSWTAGPTRLFLYNPSTNGSIYITCQRRSPTPTTVTNGPVAARGVTTVDLYDYSGAHCYASNSSGTPTGEPIFAIATVDTSINDGESQGDCWDWSFVLYPESMLTTEAVVGLGLGRDPNTSSTQNGNPIWVTTVCTTYLYVDWNGDGTADYADLDGDGDYNGTVDGVSESTSNQGMLVTPLKSVRLFEPPLDSEEYDQTAARIWTRTASGVGYGGTPGCKLAAAWGEDPRIASPASPGLDVGTSVPPFRLVEGAKGLELKVDADNSGYLSVGDTATYSMTVKNVGPTDVAHVYVYDTVPANTSYVINTTEAYTSSSTGWVDIPDDLSGTPFPLDDTTAPPPDGIYLGAMAAGATFYIRFDVLLGAGPDYEDILNCDVASTSGGTLNICTYEEVASRDWGDLPDSYGTTLAADGPRHSKSNLKLGSVYDVEFDGQPSDPANGDDQAITPDDEDGVVNSATGTEWSEGNGEFSVTVAGTSGCLNAWMDFTDDVGTTPPAADGNFTMPDGSYDSYTSGETTYSEYIIQNQLLPVGTTSVAVAVPVGINGGVTTSFYLRFRLSPPDEYGECTAEIGPTGFITGGEVEDYLMDLGTPTGLAMLAFTAQGENLGIRLSWETASEVDILGFNLYRAEQEDGAKVQVNEDLIPSLYPGSPSGAVYKYTDMMVTKSRTYYYWVGYVNLHGGVVFEGPIKARTTGK